MTNLVVFNQYHTKPKHPRLQMVTQWKVALVIIVIVKININVIVSVITYNSIISSLSFLYCIYNFIYNSLSDAEIFFKT